MILFSLAIYQAQSQIKLNKLDKSFKKFINQLDVTKDKVPDKYFMSLEQFEAIYEKPRLTKKVKLSVWAASAQIPIFTPTT